MQDWLILLSGVLCAAGGGELFVRGSVGLAHWARVSPVIIGSTIAAFATSSPELSVSVRSALRGTPQIALGDALGSNIVNIALILALPAAISGLRVSRDSLQRDFPLACLTPILCAVMLQDGEISRLDGAVLLAIFLGWLVLTVREAAIQRKKSTPAQHLPGRPKRWWHPVAYCLLGLVLLVAAGGLIVSGASGIAAAAGLGTFVVGATVVAVGTSAPELATTLIAKWRGHDEVGLGTILGSNIFNGLFIIGVAACIHPISVPWSEVDIASLFGLAAILAALPPKSEFLSRRRGGLLLLLYLAYVVVILWRGAAAEGR